MRPSVRAVVVGVLLSGPLVLGLLITDGLRVPFPTFHDTDEAVYHHPTIQKFAESIPSPSLSDYGSATAPLYHLLMAFAMKTWGLDLPGLQLVNLLFSYAALLLLYAVTRRIFGSWWNAVVFTVVFGLTPYFLGRSLRLFTENLSLVFVLLGFLAYRWGSSRQAWLLSPISFTCAVLTRQSLLWFPATIALDSPAAPAHPRRALRWLSIVVPCLALLPLFVLWNGPVPPSFQAENVSSGPNLRGVCFAFAVLGFYSVLLGARHLVSWARATSVRWVASTVLLSCVVVTLVQLSPRSGDDGFLWRIARSLPDVAGGNLMFFGLVPAGVIMALDPIRRQGTLPGSYFGLFAISFIASNKCYQNYYDSLVLLFVFDRLGASGRRIEWSELAGITVLGLLSLTYVLVRI